MHIFRFSIQPELTQALLFPEVESAAHRSTRAEPGGSRGSIVPAPAFGNSSEGLELP